VDEQRQNPAIFPCSSHHWITTNAYLHNIELEQDQCAKLGKFQPLRLTDEVRDVIIQRLQSNSEFNVYKQFFRYKDFLICRLAPKKESSEEDFSHLLKKNKKQGMKFEFGDLRIMFEVVPCPKVSICGQQVQIAQLREDGSNKPAKHYRIRRWNPASPEHLALGGPIIREEVLVEG